MTYLLDTNTCITLLRSSTRVQDNLIQVRQFVQQFASLPFDSAAADQSGQIGTDLARKGTPIGPYDLPIAAIALTHNATLVTHNVREFSRVVGLQYVDWQAGP